MWLYESLGGTWTCVLSVWVSVIGLNSSSSDEFPVVSDETMCPWSNDESSVRVVGGLMTSPAMYSAPEVTHSVDCASATLV